MTALVQTLDVPARLNPGNVRVRMEWAGRKPMFCLADVCQALGYADVSKNTRQWVEDIGEDRLFFGTDCSKNQGRGRPTTYDRWYCGEGDFYRVVLKSGMPAAEEFSDWVCYEVLPCIREHGCYPAPTAIVPVARPVTDTLAVVKEFAETARDILSIGGLDSRDEVILKDWVRNRLMLDGKAGGRPGGGQVWVTIPERCVELGYPRPARGEDSQVGKAVASAFRSMFGREPEKHQQTVDGRVVMVCTYCDADLPAVDAGIHAYHRSRRLLGN